MKTTARTIGMLGVLVVCWPGVAFGQVTLDSAYENGNWITTNSTRGPVGIEGHGGVYALYCTDDYTSSSTMVIRAKYTGGQANAVAVYGKSRPLNHYGTGGQFEGGYTGVKGEVFPSSGGGYFRGVWGEATGGTTGWNYGVYGTASGSGGTNIGVYGRSSSDGTTNYAGYFEGNVKVTGRLSKGSGSFQIDHPLYPATKYLSHSFVESPDMMNVYNGTILLDGDGTAVVCLPDYFEALNRDFRYQLTAIGAPAPNLHVAQEVAGNTFVIGGGAPGLKVSWQVTGIRRDAYATANPIVVEEDKPPQERGFYLHPQAFGLGPDHGLPVGSPARPVDEAMTGSAR